MSYEKHMFQQEIREKKSISYGARHKKNGSKSKKCTLPSDNLTRKEKLALNGEVTSWNMKKFYSYEEFKQMPDDIQIEYVNSILSRYDVGVHALETIVFNTSSLRKYLDRKGLAQYINKFPGGKPKKSNIERLKKDVEQSRKAFATVKSVEETDQGLKVEATLNEQNPEVLKFIRLGLDAATNSVPEALEHPSLETEISDFLIRMDRFDDRIWEWIKDLFAGEEDLQITISVVKDS